MQIRHNFFLEVEKSKGRQGRFPSNSKRVTHPIIEVFGYLFSPTALGHLYYTSVSFSVTLQHHKHYSSEDFLLFKQQF